MHGREQDSFQTGCGAPPELAEKVSNGRLAFLPRVKVSTRSQPAPHHFAPPQAIGARNARESSHKRREAGQQQLQSLIAEKRAQLERLRVEQESLERVLQDQEQFIENFVLQK